MGKYIVRRIIWLPLILTAVSAVTFTLGTYGPGDPVQVALGTKYNPKTADRLRESLGLNRPVLIQYVDYMWGVVKGDFGESFRYRGRSVSSLLFPKMLVSYQVNLVALTVSVFLGLPLGFWLAHKQGSWMDPAAVSVSLVLMSVPIMAKNS